MADCGMSLSFIRNNNAAQEENQNLQQQPEVESGGRIVVGAEGGRGPNVMLRCDCNKSNGLDASCKCTTPLRRTHALTLTRAADDYQLPSPPSVDPRRRGRRYATDVNNKYWENRQGAVTLTGDNTTVYRPRINTAATSWRPSRMGNLYEGPNAPHWMDGPTTAYDVDLSGPAPRERLVIKNNNPHPDGPVVQQQRGITVSQTWPNTMQCRPLPRPFSHDQSSVTPASTAPAQVTNPFFETSSTPPRVPATPVKEQAEPTTYVGVLCDAAGRPQQLADVAPPKDAADQASPCVEAHLHVPMLPHGQQIITGKQTEGDGTMRYNFASQGKSCVEVRQQEVDSVPQWREKAVSQSQGHLPTASPVKPAVAAYHVNRGYDYGLEQYKISPAELVKNAQPPPEGNVTRNEKVDRCQPELDTSGGTKRESTQPSPAAPGGDQSFSPLQKEHAQRHPPGPAPQATRRSGPHSPEHVYQV